MVGALGYSKGYLFVVRDIDCRTSQVVAYSYTEEDLDRVQVLKDDDEEEEVGERDREERMATRKIVYRYVFDCGKGKRERLGNDVEWRSGAGTVDGESSTIQRTSDPFERAVVAFAHEANVLAVPSPSRIGEVMIYSVGVNRTQGSISTADADPPSSGAETSEDHELLREGDPTDHHVIILRAHDSEIQALALSPDGRFLATASEKGTLIRVFALFGATPLESGDEASPTGARIFRTFRRGMSRCTIFSMAFSGDSQRLSVYSSRGTLHLFALNREPESGSNRRSRWAFLSFLPGLSGVVDSEWSARDCRLATEPAPRGVCSFVPSRNKDDSLILVARNDGIVQSVSFLAGGGTRCETHHFGDKGPVRKRSRAAVGISAASRRLDPFEADQLIEEGRIAVVIVGVIAPRRTRVQHTRYPVPLSLTVEDFLASIQGTVVVEGQVVEEAEVEMLGCFFLSLTVLKPALVSSNSPRPHPFDGAEEIRWENGRTTFEELRSQFACSDGCLYVKLELSESE